MSTLHWHVVDSQSFPLVVQGFEELSQKGAYSPTKIYSLANVQDITSYAAAVRIPFTKDPQLKVHPNSEALTWL